MKKEEGEQENEQRYHCSTEMSDDIVAQSKEVKKEIKIDKRVIFVQ